MPFEDVSSRKPRNILAKMLLKQRRGKSRSRHSLGRSCQMSLLLLSVHFLYQHKPKSYGSSFCS